MRVVVDVAQVLELVPRKMLDRREEPPEARQRSELFERSRRTGTSAGSTGRISTSVSVAENDVLAPRDCRSSLACRDRPLGARPPPSPRSPGRADVLSERVELLREHAALPVGHVHFASVTVPGDGAQARSRAGHQRSLLVTAVVVRRGSSSHALDGSDPRPGKAGVRDLHEMLGASLRSGGDRLLAGSRRRLGGRLPGGLAEHPQCEDQEADAREQQGDAHDDREGGDAFGELGRAQRR